MLTDLLVLHCMQITDKGRVSFNEKFLSHYLIIDYQVGNLLILTMLHHQWLKQAVFGTGMGLRRSSLDQV